MSKILVTLVPLMIISVFLLAACQPQVQPAEIPPDSEWSAVALDGKPLVTDTHITLKFGAEGTGGISGCNHYGSTVTRQGDKITFTNTFMTEMYCMEPAGVMEQEAAYLDALGRVASYRFAGEKLELLDANGKVLIAFEKVIPPPPASLEGTQWNLTSFVSGDAVSSLLAETTITFQLLDGKLNGNAGCNTYFSGYTLDGEKLTFEAVASTRMYCGEPEGLMQQEADYLQALAKVASFRITGNQLELLDGDGAALLVFVVAGE